MKLKIFSSQEFLPQKPLPATLQYVSILTPFFGKLPDDPKHFKVGLFDKFIENSSSFLEMTSDLKEADIAIFPTYWNLLNSDESFQSFQLIEQAKELDKTVAIFFQGDWNQTLNQENTLIFSTASFQSQRKPNEFTMPSWTSDYIGEQFQGSIPIREKQAKPKVGFCGYAPPLGLSFGVKKLKAYLRFFGDSIGLAKKLYSETGHTNRVKALSNLSKNSSITTNFMTRQHFAFSSKTLQSSSAAPEKIAHKVRQEYFQNMIDSDYILCCSGYENYSIRLYETLSCGRIPVFINTDCVLPYDFAIDWKKYCVWVDRSELSLIGEKILDFHNNLSTQEFIDLQHECRQFWEKWISPEGFFSNFYRHLEQYNQWNLIQKGLCQSSL
jgi:hypothetical protein